MQPTAPIVSPAMTPANPRRTSWTPIVVVVAAIFALAALGGAFILAFVLFLGVRSGPVAADVAPAPEAPRGR